MMLSVLQPWMKLLMVFFVHLQSVFLDFWIVILVEITLVQVGVYNQD
jgi:hypothetical protein